MNYDILKKHHSASFLWDLVKLGDIKDKNYEDVKSLVASDAIYYYNALIERQLTRPNKNFAVNFAQLLRDVPVNISSLIVDTKEASCNSIKELLTSLQSIYRKEDFEKFITNEKLFSCNYHLVFARHFKVEISNKSAEKLMTRFNKNREIVFFSPESLSEVEEINLFTDKKDLREWYIRQVPEKDYNYVLEDMEYFNVFLEEIGSVATPNFLSHFYWKCVCRCAEIILTHGEPIDIEDYKKTHKAIREIYKKLETLLPEMPEVPKSFIAYMKKEYGSTEKFIQDVLENPARNLDYFPNKSVELEKLQLELSMNKTVRKPKLLKV